MLLNQVAEESRRTAVQGLGDHFIDSTKYSFALSMKHERVRHGFHKTKSLDDVPKLRILDQSRRLERCFE